MDNSNIINKDTSELKQEQVEKHIRKMIQAGEWKEGQKIPSERELSQSLDVSRTTVRNAILKMTNKGIFERIIGQGTFIRSVSSLQKALPETEKQTGNIGYVVCKERNIRKPLSHEAFYFDVFSGIEESIAIKDKHILFTYLNDFDQQEIAQFDQFLDKVDGVIIEELRNRNILDSLKNRNIPIVLLAPTIESSDTDLITIDLYQGVQKAVRYLQSLGHRRIAIIDGPLHLETAQIRHKAWEDAMIEAIGTNPDDLSVGGAAWTTDSGYEAMKDLLSRGIKHSAVFCVNDLIAIGAMQAIKEAGLSIPEDISVMGFDDIEVAGLPSISLTSMKIYSRRMGHSAARRILEHLEDGQSPPVTITFPIDIVIRNSCKEVKDS